MECPNKAYKKHIKKVKERIITPAIKVLYLSPLCDGNNGFQVTSVRQKSLNGPKIDEFGVVEQEVTKKDDKYKDLWGNTNLWGDD